MVSDDVDLTRDRVLKDTTPQQANLRDDSEVLSIFDSIQRLLSEQVPGYVVKRRMPWDDYEAQDIATPEAMSFGRETEDEYADRVGLNLCCRWLQTGDYQEYKSKLNLYDDVMGNKCECCGRDMTNDLDFNHGHLCSDCSKNLDIMYEHNIIMDRIEGVFRDESRDTRFDYNV
ncbi:hypothetical protein HNP86_002024 [Methanococcus maripaludis]|uniref:Uncharacterized protein n=1 Tax=Methanococcus maripaludis TaxID=39152 RepID=A0A7J9NX95_METMI|nr:hypothetical protein [Methanococcus maripaludis]MBA2851865.1 hypothetical protein [Methanococcus maripaludis]